MQAADEEFKFGRVIDEDKSVRPSRDTGFRMAATTPTAPYVRPTPRQYPPLIDFLHNDDMEDIGQGTLNGQPLDRIRAYRVNYDKATARLDEFTRRTILDTN